MTAPQNHSAAYRLFHYKYEVRLPALFMYGPEYLKKHGYRVSGEAGLDHLRLRELIVVRQTPAGMALLHNEGASIDFLDHRDSVQVYQDIQEHLMDWERMVQQWVHPDDVPPIEEFRMFEAIAMAIYETAKFYQPDERYGDTLRDALMAMNRRRNPTGTERYLRNKITTEQGTLKPYVSIVDRIERELMRNAEWQ